MNKLSDRFLDIGEYVPAPDDHILICRCEEITKGEILCMMASLLLQRCEDIYVQVWDFVRDRLVRN